MLAVDTVLDNRFKLVGKPLGRGGFAITYLGLDTRTNQPVAIKELFPIGNGGCLRASDGLTVLPAKPAEFALQREKFHREAQLLKSIDHERVVRVVKVFEANGTVYLVMELVQGETLLTKCENKPLALDEALALFEKLATALEAVHRVGILHRDVNPRNVILTRFGPVLIDFGLARQEVTDSESLSAVAYPGFAPLEQYNPKGARGPFVDVYSLTALLYLMLTGEAPEASINRYDIDTGTDALVSPAVLRPDLPSWACAGILSGLTLSSSKRPQNVAALRTLLEAPAPVIVPSSPAPVVEPASPIPKQDANNLAKRRALRPEVKVEGGIVGPLPDVVVRPSGLTVVEAKSLPPTHPAPLTLAEYKAQMVKIPGSTFQMGGTQSDDEKPVHRVTLSPFAIGRTPVTVAMWQEFCNATGREMPEAPEFPVWKQSMGMLGFGFGKTYSWDSLQDHPMVNVSWEDCTAYADWAGLKLPTEAQWEYAARGGLKGKEYPWGDAMDDSKLWCSKIFWRASSIAPTSRSKNVFVNGYGLLDMSGNVGQWCSNWYDAYGSEAEVDPTGPSSGKSRVLRCGDWWEFEAVYFRCAYRNWDTPDHRSYKVGFRLSSPGS